jgi:L-aminopeptidase/D-esterase-like protein
MPPSWPPFSDRLEIPGFTLGHGTDLEGMTGVTVILCPEGAVAAAEVRGSATGTRQFDSLVDPRHLATRAHAVVLAGGSGFGLGAADVVVEHLAARGAGFDTGFARVPLVPTAILFDLAFGRADVWPGRALAEEAVARATGGPVAMGSVGAGTGATVGKVGGPARAMKGGVGFASITVPGGPTVAAVVAVNAFGDVRDPETGRPVAGCRRAPDSLLLSCSERELASLAPGAEHRWEGNTTLAVVLTDGKLSKIAVSKVCQMAFGGLYRALAPAVSLYDGDLVVTLARGEVAAHPNQIGVLAQRAVGEAIVRGVSAADGFGVLPAVRDLT